MLKKLKKYVLNEYFFGDNFKKFFLEYFFAGVEVIVITFITIILVIIASYLCYLGYNFLDIVFKLQGK